MRTAMPREFYIPKGAIKIRPKDVAAEFYTYESDGRPYALAFIGKAQKPSWHYRFLNLASREARIRSTIEACRANAEYAAKRKAELAAAKAKGHGWEKGLILVASWGYEQTNVDFYEVVEILGKTMVKLEKIGATTATDDTDGGSSMSRYVVPDPEHRSGKFIRCQPRNGWAKVSSCSSAYVWDGLKRYCSWYA